MLIDICHQQFFCKVTLCFEIINQEILIYLLTARNNYSTCFYMNWNSVYSQLFSVSLIVNSTKLNNWCGNQETLVIGSWVLTRSWVLSPIGVLGLHRVLVLIEFWVLLGSWVLRESWVFVWSWVLGPVFSGMPVCLQTFINYRIR